ncbi:MAG: glycosyltransferase [Gallionellaceae bacterium]|nr:glycosyltransferase [Gallionellaceae bacterium]
MKVLFVYPVAMMSVSDVAAGYHQALLRAGHDVKVYHLGKRWAYHDLAINPDLPEPERLRALSKQASETMVIEAWYHDADLVLIVSGLSVHPLALQLLRKGGIPTCVIHTESPYQDEQQAEWSAHYPGMLCCTHERTSAEKYGWLYLPHAYDPMIHWPHRHEDDVASDVLLLGTGWPERVKLLEAVDWTGIDLRLIGLWQLDPASPLQRAYRPGIVANIDAPRLYASAKVCLNLHRHSDEAVSANPRAYELAACGACQLSDARADVRTLFDGSVPTFTTPAELSDRVRQLLASPSDRRTCAAEARARVDGETFDARLDSLLTHWRAGYGNASRAA